MQSGNIKTTRDDWRGALDSASRHSPFLARMQQRFPDISALLAQGEVDQALALAHKAGEGAVNVAQSLRRRKGAIALVTAMADLAGAWDLGQVSATLSDFADTALDEAIAAAFAERYPDEPVCGFTVLALGKHGSRELNYSSDIDPILIFDPATLPHKSREEPVEAAVRIGRRVSELLTARDSDGYVFRVDLRLRPSPEATPIALPVEAAISYYESTALGWEQAAFIRARTAAGDRSLGSYFLHAIRPFIWRRSLDFGAIDAIMDISRRIRDHYAQGQAFGPGYDLKRGRGGIREVEFFAQVHQLIHGGRNPDLRSGDTRQALAALCAAGIIDAETAARLDSGYVLLRTIEHRLQMVDDRQTHELPERAESLDNVAGLHGLSDGQALLGLLEPHIRWIGGNFDKLAPPADRPSLSPDPETLLHQLSNLGFTDPAVPQARIIKWRDGSIRALRSPAAQSAFDELLPSLMQALAQAPDPEQALNRLADLIARLPSAINFFKLLANRPALAGLVVRVLSYAPTLAAELSRRAELLDGLIDSTALNPPPPVAELARQLSQTESGDDYQILLDRVRQKVGERRFALGVQIISGMADPVDVAAGYSRVAEAAIETLAQATIAEFEQTHGKVPGGELVILALGRLGGGMLTHASDLDLVYLFTGEFSAESDGRKPLGATQYFNRLAQRVTAALSAPTASGPLYEVDTRLRPSGAQGLLAVSFDSFAKYQREEAWAWEHMALTRARPVFGSAQARAALDGIIDGILRMPRDFPRFARDAIKMRNDIATHKPPDGDLDVKLVPGGLVDLEFTVHTTQFRHGAGFDPALDRALAQLIAAGHLPAELDAAHRLIARMLIVFRLVAPKAKEPPAAARRLAAEVCGAGDWDDLLAQYARARQSISSRWEEFVSEFGETA